MIKNLIKLEDTLPLHNLIECFEWKWDQSISYNQSPVPLIVLSTQCRFPRKHLKIENKKKEPLTILNAVKSKDSPKYK